MTRFSLRRAIPALAAFGLLALAPGAQAQRAPSTPVLAAVEGTVTLASAASGTTPAMLTIKTSRNVSVSMVLNSSTRLIVDGRPAAANFDLSILLTAHAAAIYKPGTSPAPNTAIQVQAATPSVSGTILPNPTAGPANSLMIKTAAGTTVTLGVNAATKFVVDGKPLTTPPALTTLIGDRVAATYNGSRNVALIVQAFTPRVEGTITDASATSVTIKPNAGTAIALVVVPNTTLVFINGSPGTLSAALKNSRAVATYHVMMSATTTVSTNVAVRIDVRTSHVEGTISTADNTAGTLTIQPERGPAVTVVVTAAQLIVDGVTISVAKFDLTTLKGGRAFATYTTAPATTTTMATNTALLVRAISTPPAHIEGALSNVTVGATPLTGSLTITPHGGTGVVLAVNANTQLRYNGASTTLTALMALTTKSRAIAAYISTTNVALSVDVFSQ